MTHPTPPRTILFATDFSARCDRPLDRAATPSPPVSRPSTDGPLASPANKNPSTNFTPSRPAA